MAINSTIVGGKQKKSQIYRSKKPQKTRKTSILPRNQDFSNRCIWAHWSRTFRSIPHRKLAELLCNDVCSNREKIYSILRQRLFGKWCFMFLRKNSLFLAHFAKEFFGFCEISQNFNPLQLSSDLSKQCKPPYHLKGLIAFFPKMTFLLNFKLFWVSYRGSELVILGFSPKMINFGMWKLSLRCAKFILNLCFGKNTISAFSQYHSLHSLLKSGKSWNWLKFCEISKSCENFFAKWA